MLFLSIPVTGALLQGRERSFLVDREVIWFRKVQFIMIRKAGSRVKSAFSNSYRKIKICLF